MLAADARCGLFEPQVRAALDVSAHQARGAALRAGATGDELANTGARAVLRARTADCASDDLTTAAARVRDGFAGWRRTARMTFPGERQDWSADRTRYGRDAWRLSQTGRFRSAPVTFGRVTDAGGEEGLAAVVSFPGRPRPYGARIVLRDPARAHRPWIIQASVGLLPPANTRRAFWAASQRGRAREPAAGRPPSGRDLALPGGGGRRHRRTGPARAVHGGVPVPRRQRHAGAFRGRRLRRRPRFPVARPALEPDRPRAAGRPG